MSVMNNYPSCSETFSVLSSKIDVKIFHELQNEVCPLYMFVPPIASLLSPLLDLRLGLDTPSQFSTSWCLQMMHAGSPFTRQSGVWVSAYVYEAIRGHVLMRALAAGGLWKMLEVLGWDSRHPWDVMIPDTWSVTLALCSVTWEWCLHVES